MTDPEVARELGRLAAVVEGVGESVKTLAAAQADNLEQYNEDKTVQAVANANICKELKALRKDVRESPRGFGPRAVGGAGIVGAFLSWVYGAVTRHVG